MNPLPRSTATRLKTKSAICVLVFVVAVLVVVSMTLTRKSLARRGDDVAPVAQAHHEHQAAKAYGKLPLSFERNDGQAPEAVRFMSRGVGYSLFLTPNQAVLTLRGHSAAKTGDAAQTTEGYKVIRMKLLGANANPETVGLEELPGKLNYFIGNEPAKWAKDVSLYAKVQYRSVYDGIDLLYYGNQRQLEYDFQVAPGHDPRAIKLEFEGADRIKVDENDGSLVLAIEQSEVRFKRPVIYQLSDEGNREEIDGGYSVKGKVVQFRVADFDARKPLVIDPILSYSTYLGANSNEIGWGIAVDSSGSAYVAGQSGSTLFPTTGVNFIPQGTSGHAFITKLDPTGSSLVYSTMIGGNSSTIAFAIAIDATGGAAITGRTSSVDFPTVNPIRANTNLVKSANSGASWVAANSGLGNLAVIDLAVNPLAPSTIYAAVSGGSGIYKSSDSGATWSALNTGATFVTALAVDPQTPATIYATVNSPFFGAIKSVDAGATWTQINTGLSGGFLYSIAVNPQTPATVYAGTNSGVFKSTNGGASWQSSNTGLNSTPLILAIDPTTPSTLYAGTGGGGVFKSTNSGGNWAQMNTGLTNTIVGALLIDPTNSATVYVGTIGGGIFKSTNGAGNWSPVNTGLTVTTVKSLAFDPAGGAIYAGTPKSTVFKSVNGGGSWAGVYSSLTGPVVETLAIGGSNVYAGVDTRLTQTDNEAFVTKLNPAGNAIVFSTFLGGGGNEDGLGIAIDGGGNVVVTGQTESSDFPVANPRQANLQGTIDAFVTKFPPSGAPLVYSTYLGGTSNDAGRGVAADASGNAYVAGVTSSTNFPTTPGVFQTTLAGTFFPSDAFVTKIDAAGSQFVYSTYLGGNGGDGAFGIAVDTSGNAFVAGSTDSSTFPVVNPAQPVATGGGDGFVTRLNSTATALSYSSYLGGDALDQIRGIAIDGSGSAYVTGFTRSANFPTTSGNPGSSSEDAFVSRFTPTGNLAYSTYLGGDSNPGDTATDQGFAIAADAAGNTYVTGLARAKDFPVTPNAYQPFNRGFDDAFVAKLSPSFSISGVVTNAGATPQGGVKITLSGSATNALVTGVDGSYLFTNLQPGGNYTVSATKTGASFAPPLQSFNNLSADQTANFTLSPTATAFHTISGRIAEADNTAIPNVTVSLTGSQIEFATTNSDGNYSFSAPAGGNYTVTPSSLGFVFSPPSQSVNNLSANTQVNFTGTRQSFVVTNTNDHGAGSLRQAIIDANATFGADRIVFQIPGSGVQTIKPTAPMPEIKDPVTLDGTTQPGFAGSPLIELDGSNQVSGLVISAGNSTVRGLVINRFFDGINLKTLGGNHIEGNIIGLDPTGTIKRPNASGITISGSNGNFIGGVTPAQRNIISGNSSNGIQLLASGNQIKGNYIGTNAAGTAGLGNGSGITMTNFVGQPSDANQIGGTEPGARNVISGNAAGIDVEGAGTIIQGNLIGTDVSGTVKIGNEMYGVNVDISGVTLGGTTPAARNIISGNGTGVSVNLSFGTGTPFIIFKGNYIGTDISGTAKLGNGTGVAFTGQGTLGGTEPGAGNLISGNEGPGVQLNCCGSGSTVVQGNLIGTDVTGMLPLGNGQGMSIQSSQNTIGGPQPGARNVISGNDIGIRLGGLTFPGPFANILQGNYIGVNALGNAPLGNTSRGLELNDSSNTVVGGSQPGEGNVLAFNSVGVVASQSVINTLIRGNSIFSNAGLGIDLNFDGVVTANDPGDSDTGANRLQNFPVISSITTGAGGTNVKGSLNSSPSTQFQIDFYLNLACDVSGNGEGTVPFGFTTVTTDTNGNATFEMNLPAQVPANRTVTATATDPAGNSSEFSACDPSGTAGSLEFSAVDFNAREDVGNAVIRVVRTGGSRGTLTVNYATGAGTATAGTDYTAASGTLSFGEGETEKTFNVPIVNDGVTESEETVALTLSGATNLRSLGAKYRATLHIFDGNTALTISGNDAQIVEGDFGQRNVVVPVTVSAASGQTVTVNYATAQGGSSNIAVSGKDFLPVSGTLVFAPGVETQNVIVPILADALDEADETFLVSLSGAVNATVVRTSVVRVFDDDPLPSLSVTDVSVAEATGANAVFTVRLSAPSGRTVQLTYATANGTATAGSDYTNTNSFLSFAPGETVQQISVPILTDGIAESDETFFLNLATPARATIADAQGLGTIIDASASTTVVRFSAATYAVNEGDGQAQVTVTRSGSTASESAVSYKTIGGTANERSDFTPSYGTLRFAAGETSKTFNVLVTDDAFLETPESLDLILSNPSGAVLGGPNTASLSITSNDVADGPSPVREQSFDARFFVRQHYHDFLNREPDTAGLDFWVGQIEGCGADAACLEVKKINVSAAFFLSIEFQETGYLAYRMYNAGYGETTSPNVAGTVPIVRLQDFLPDSQQIGQGVQVGIGNWQQQLEDNKTAYAVDFVRRQRFIDAFPLTMTADEFIAKLDQNTNGVLSAAEKSQLAAMLTMPADAAQRGAVVRKVAEDSDLRQRELNRAFVLMQFYGYLRRNPDDPQDTDFRGWKFWLDKLNQFNGNFVDAEMVKAFLLSGEYRQRFGTP